MDNETKSMNLLRDKIISSFHEFDMIFNAPHRLLLTLVVVLVDSDTTGSGLSM